MVRHDCPIPEYKGKDYFVEVPERWTGGDWINYSKASDIASKNKLPALFHNYAVGLAIASDWKLPGLEGKPENWKFEGADFELMCWVIELTVNDINAKRQVKKNYLSVFGNR